MDEITSETDIRFTGGKNDSVACCTILQRAVWTCRRCSDSAFNSCPDRNEKSHDQGITWNQRLANKIAPGNPHLGLVGKELEVGKTCLWPGPKRGSTNTETEIVIECILGKVTNLPSTHCRLT